MRKTLKEKREVALPANSHPPGSAQTNVTPTQNVGATPNVDGDSYSRITGAVGAIVIASFIWGLGNTVIFKAFTAPSDVPNILNGVGTFILTSSALFAPYAFNQLSNLFPKPHT